MRFHVSALSDAGPSFASAAANARKRRGNDFAGLARRAIVARRCDQRYDDIADLAINDLDVDEIARLGVNVAATADGQFVVPSQPAH